MSRIESAPPRPYRTLVVYMDADLHAALVRRATEEGISRNELARAALRREAGVPPPDPAARRRTPRSAVAAWAAQREEFSIRDVARRFDISYQAARHQVDMLVHRDGTVEGRAVPGSPGGRKVFRYVAQPQK